jgi:hypothetical protein
MLFDLTSPCYLTTFMGKKCLSGKVNSDFLFPLIEVLLYQKSVPVAVRLFSTEPAERGGLPPPVERPSAHLRRPGGHPALHREQRLGQRLPRHSAKHPHGGWRTPNRGTPLRSPDTRLPRAPFTLVLPLTG